MMLIQRAAAIASVTAIVASTSVMAQTTGSIPPRAPPSQASPPSTPTTAKQYSSNEIIDAADGPVVAPPIHRELPVCDPSKRGIAPPQVADKRQLAVRQRGDF